MNINKYNKYEVGLNISIKTQLVSSNVYDN